MFLNLQVSPVFLKNLQAKKRIVINCGGTRSSKTYSILQVILYYVLTNTGKIVDIVRKTRSEIHETVLPDWIKILTSAGIYNERDHNKTRSEFTINGNIIRFLGMDKSHKKRGSTRHVLYINEATGITLEDWVQLSIRTEERIYMDYNPSEYFWVNEHILEKRNDYDYIHSTYLDNYDFLPAEQIEEIENLINVDDFYYQVYVLGNLAALKGKIYNNYHLIEPELYNGVDYDEKFYGIDWGYEHAMVLMEIKYAQEQVYERELYYATHKYDTDLIDWMLRYNISMHDDIYADPAYPASIRKMRNAGFNVHKANKDVDDGIRFCQGLKRNICKSSTNYLRQINRYKWKQVSDGSLILTPVKIDDDCMDAMRYPEYTHLKKRAA